MRIAGLVSSMGEPTTRAAVESIRPHVDSLIAIIDDRTPVEFDATLGVETHRFTWADDFAEIPNFGMSLLEGRADRVIQIDADELLYDGDKLLRAAEIYPDADVIALPRRHFWTMDRTRERLEEPWWPDWQYRFRKPHVRMERRAHPYPAGSPRIERTTLVMLEHFNLALRSDADWHERNTLFNRLAAMDRGEST